MKKSSDWNRQPNVDKAADAILAEGKATLDTITAYQVAERLGGSANPSLYAKFRDWRARCRAAAEPVTVDVPPEVEANIRAIFARLTDDGVSACLDAVRTVGGNLDRVMTMRVTVAEHRAEKAEAETTEVLAIGEKIEEELHAANGRIGELEQAVSDGQRREDRLAGRIEQLEADLAAARRHRPRNVAAGTEASDGAAQGSLDDDGDGLPEGEDDAGPTSQLRLTFAGIEAGEQDGEDAH